jgi:hypothetical protein
MRKIVIAGEPDYALKDAEYKKLKASFDYYDKALDKEKNTQARAMIKKNYDKAAKDLADYRKKKRLASTAASFPNIMKEYREDHCAPVAGPMLLDLKSIPKCEATLTVWKKDPKHIWVFFMDDEAIYCDYNKSFPNDKPGYAKAHAYYTKAIHVLKSTPTLKLVNDNVDEILHGSKNYAMSSSNTLTRKEFRKQVVASYITKANIKGTAGDEASRLNIDLAGHNAMVLAFEHTLRNFDPSIAIAYNMNQTKTRMSKEALAGKIQSHKDWIKRRKDKIKMLEMQKKASAMKPEKVQKLSQRITKQHERIDHHNEAIKYYKMLSSIKPIKKKVNPAKPDQKQKPIKPKK